MVVVVEGGSEWRREEEEVEEEGGGGGGGSEGQNHRGAKHAGEALCWATVPPRETTVEKLDTRKEGGGKRRREGGRDGEQLVILVFFPAALCSAFQVLGGVLHILHNNSCHLEMCVDSWPTFTTAICYRQKQQFSSSRSSRSSSVAIPDICTVFTENPAALRGLLLNERVVNWKSGLIFRGSIPSSHCHLIKELASLSGLDITEYGGYTTFIHHTPEDMDWQKISLRITNVLPPPICILDESHAELVDACLPYGGSQESINHVRACIRHLPNHCVTDETGRPVAWMLSDELCELRMAYTLPECRRAGLLLVLSLSLMRRMSSMGLPCLLSRPPAEPGHS
ncbi:Glycine N-acyltransferase [Nibea albiflora]|uniref:Glycine N-acyltransferase n=1 Tax=Nibea albiflora TaxID=240163 RepID=A0ACB7EL23_NIBAL|nr:Glycine N-acyltransferase [Nibea albiflora]